MTMATSVHEEALGAGGNRPEGMDPNPYEENEISMSVPQQTDSQDQNQNATPQETWEVIAMMHSPSAPAISADPVSSRWECPSWCSAKLDPDLVAAPHTRATFPGDRVCASHQAQIPYSRVGHYDSGDVHLPYLTVEAIQFHNEARPKVLLERFRFEQQGGSKSLAGMKVVDLYAWEARALGEALLAAADLVESERGRPSEENRWTS